MHMKVIKLADGLQIAGLGGSAPIHVIEPGQTQQKPIWEKSSYPFGTEENFKKAVDQLWSQVQGEDQVVLLTHDGPYGKATTSYLENDGSFFKFGSPGLTSLLEANQSRIVFNVHGHCHAGRMYDRIGDLHVFNPNSLVAGNFMEIVLKREETSGKWKLNSVTKRFG